MYVYKKISSIVEVEKYQIYIKKSPQQADLYHQILAPKGNYVSSTHFPHNGG